MCLKYFMVDVTTCCKSVSRLVFTENGMEVSASWVIKSELSTSVKIVLSLDMNFTCLLLHVCVKLSFFESQSVGEREVP